MVKNIKYLLKAYLFRYKVPRLVVLNVTALCSGTCEYCGTKGSAEEDMTTEDIFRIIDELSEMGCASLALTGGDPLFRDDIEPIIDHAHSRGMKTCICSDGSNVEEKREAVRKSDFLQLSLDGPEDIHDRLKYSGAYGKYINARDVAIEEGTKFFTLTVLTKLNIPYIDFVLEEARKYKSYAFFQPLSRTYFYDDVSPPELKPGEEELRSAFKQLIRAKRGPYRYYMGDTVKVLKHFVDPDSKYRCYAGKFFAYIHNNGDVYPCWTPPLIEAHNSLKEGFKRAFLTMPDVKCNTCQVSSLVQMNYMAGLNINVILNIILRIFRAKIGTFVKSRFHSTKSSGS